MTIFIASIIILTFIFAYLYKAQVIKVCPICAGVVLTWTAGLVSVYTNQTWANPLVVAILMGASLGALADKYGNKLGLVWKSALIVVGLPAIYMLLQKKLLFGLALLLIIILMTFFFSKRSGNKTSHKDDLFKDCC